MLINAIQLKRANDEKSSYVSKDKATKSYRSKIRHIYHSIHYLFILENNLINKSMMLKLVLNRIEINKKLPKMFKLMEVNN